MAEQGRRQEFPNRLKYEMKIETVPCRTCKAPAGMPCITTAGKNPGQKLKGFHKFREDDALGKRPTPAAILKEFGEKPGETSRWLRRRKKG
jgi:hypothetical protein